jgi:nucleotidyltransferase/DNA polymerase involved in DNA repair
MRLRLWDRLSSLIARLRGAEQADMGTGRLRARLSRLIFVLTRRRFDEDARLEIHTHLESLTERYLRQGMSPDEAYVAARRQFGNTSTCGRIYGVLACAVRQRSTEIGIRVALGATALQVRALVFRQAAVVVSLGIAARLTAALTLGR